MRDILRENDVEGVLIADDSVIQKQKKSLNEYIQPLGSQLLIKVDELSINFKSSSDSESEEFILREKSLQDISTVGYNFREPYKNNGNTEHINFTVANLNLIVKKQNEHKKENIPIPIKLEQDTDKSPIIYSMAHHFKTSSAENEEKISVEKRLKSAKRVIDNLGLRCSNPNKTDNGCFDQRFRHGEQALFEYLKTDGFILYLIDYMHKKNVIKLQSVILDIYSTKNMCKNCQYSTYGVLSNKDEQQNQELVDKIEQENQEFCGKLEQQIKKDNETGIEEKYIAIGGTNKEDGKKRTTFYRAVRLVFSEFFDHQFENQHKFMLNSPMYIQNINKRIIAKEYTDKSSERYGLLIRDYTIFCSRGSYANVLVEQLKIDRKRSENETNTKNNGGENRNLERENSAVEE